MTDHPQSGPPPHTEHRTPNAAHRPPSAAQFFLTPMLLVAVLVIVWLFVGWLGKPVDDPKDLIRELRKPGHCSWQKALAVANLLRDPQHAELKRDQQAAGDLAALLREQIAAARLDADSIRLRIYVCRALGEFECPDALPALIQASREERHPVEIEVRRSALEALAVWAAQRGPEHPRADEDLMAAVTSACFESDAAGEDRAALRAAAAFTLGVVGGERADQALSRLLADPYPDVRYNAATGLARHGRREALPVLLEMLDPECPEPISHEASQAGQEWKRALVITNALRAVRQLAEQNRSADWRPVQTALLRLVRGRVSPAVQSEARETLHAVQAL